MKHEVLASLEESELDEYAKICGIDLSGASSREEKISTIEDKRAKVVTINLLGEPFEIPIRRLRDKRLNDSLNNRSMTDKQAASFMKGVLGIEQFDKLIERITDEDGVVDFDAYGLALRVVLTDPALKNF